VESKGTPVKALKRFLELESSGGVTLMAAAVLALVCANTPWLSSLYLSLLDTPIEIKLGALELKKNFLLIVNHGLMAVFFLLVGLEIKREILEGQLSRRDQIALPVVAAVGGMLVPSGTYWWLNRGSEAALNGWAIPAATDIAFSLGILSLLGSRVPLGLKVLLTAIAIVDDLGAIIIIAIFYTARLSAIALALSLAGLALLIILNRLRVTRLGGYLLVGIIIWICLVKSGVHATLAGVALAFTIPLKGKGESDPSPLRHLEHSLHPWVAFMILPLFAFTNAGMSIAGMSSTVWTGRVALGIAVGLTAGKFLGVMGFSAAAIGLGVARRPENVSWAGLAGMSMLAGIGFTMSLFIGTLAFQGLDAEYVVATRFGVFAGSIVSAVVGFLFLRFLLPHRK
jgi:NhaA family Na+:H+ antiporter